MERVLGDHVRQFTLRPEFPQGLKPAVLLLELMYGLNRQREKA
jgi:hypothetical protein